MPTKTNLKHTKRLIKTLDNFFKILGQVAEHQRGKILDNWIKGFGAGGKKMKNLKEPYKTLKAEGKVRISKKGKGAGGALRGGEPMRNLLLTGNLHQGFKARKEGNGYVLGWESEIELNKARGNYNAEKKMLRVTDQMVTASNKLAEKLLWKEVNKG